MFVDYGRADKNITEKLSRIDVAKPAAYNNERKKEGADYFHYLIHFQVYAWWAYSIQRLLLLLPNFHPHTPCLKLTV